LGSGCNIVGAFSGGGGGGGATTTIFTDNLTSHLTTTSTSAVDSGLTITLGSEGKTLLNASLMWNSNGAGGGQFKFLWNDDGSAEEGLMAETRDANTPQNASRVFATESASQVVKLQISTDANTLTLYGGSGSESNMYALEVA